jgi:hypothetical protein
MRLDLSLPAASYAQAQEKFLAAAQFSDAKLVAFENPIKGVGGDGSNERVGTRGRA